MSYTIQIERLRNKTPDLERLFQCHYAEIQEGYVRKGVPMSDFNPDWEKYHAMEDNNSLITFVARDELEVAVGYFLVQLFADINNGEFVAQDSAIYVEPEHRGKGVGKVISAAVMDLLKRMRVQQFHVTCPVDSKAVEVYKHMGFIPVCTQLTFVFKD